MAGYSLTIKNNADVIEISTKDLKDKAPITKAKFTMNTLDDLSRNRADAVRAELVIEGNISEEYKEEIRKLAKWSLDSNKTTQYRNVELIVNDGQDMSGKVLRRYTIDQMFVIDYEEKFKEGDSESGIYKLFIAQKQGSYKKEVFCS